MLPEDVTAPRSKALRNERNGLLVRAGELGPETERLERDAGAALDCALRIGSGLDALDDDGRGMSCGSFVSTQAGGLFRPIPIKIEGAAPQ